VKLTTYLHLVPRSKDVWSCPPNTPSWRGAQLKHRDNFFFTFAIFQFNVETSEIGTKKNKSSGVVNVKK
jgi:hypothetical protein